MPFASKNHLAGITASPRASASRKGVSELLPHSLSTCTLCSFQGSACCSQQPTSLLCLIMLPTKERILGFPDASGVFRARVSDVAGKRELPAQLRQHFTEIFVPELISPEDLSPIVFQYLRPVSITPPVEAIVGFYLAARAAAVRPCFLPLEFKRLPKICPKDWSRQAIRWSLEPITMANSLGPYLSNY